MNKKVTLIIQARMGSSRLPGKSMLDLAGVPLIGRILERIKRIKKANELVLAIPDTPENEILANIGRDYGLTIYAGSENDLVERYYQAALISKTDFIVRLPGDNATPEPSEIDRIIDHHISLGRPGFSSNLAPFKNSGLSGFVITLNVYPNSFRISTSFSENVFFFIKLESNSAL